MFDEKTQGRIARYRSGLSPDRITAVNALRAKLGGAAPAMSDVGQAVYGGNEAIAAGPKVMQGLSDGAGGLASILSEAFASMSGSGGDATPTPSPDALHAPKTITKAAPFRAASNSGMPGAPGGQVARRDSDLMMDDEGPAGGEKPIAPPSGKPSISQAARSSDNPSLSGGPGLADILSKFQQSMSVASFPASTSDPMAPSFSPADPASSAPMTPVAAKSAAAPVNNGVMGDIQDALQKTMGNPMYEAATAIERYLASLAPQDPNANPGAPGIRELARMNSRRAFGR